MVSSTAANYFLKRCGHYVAVATAAAAGFCVYAGVYFWHLQVKPAQLFSELDYRSAVAHSVASDLRNAMPLPREPLVPAHPPAPMPALGTVIVTIGGRGQLWVDGTRLKTARSQSLELEVGMHVIMLQRGSRIASQRVVVAGGTSQRVDFPMPAAAPGHRPGGLDSDSGSDGASDIDD